jgi:hypothetical protein
MNVSDPVDATYIVASYWYAPVLASIAIAGLLLGVYKGLNCRSLKLRGLWTMAILLCAFVVAGVVVHVVKTYDETEFLVLLGSENDRDAEQAYRSFGPRISTRRVEEVILRGTHSDNCRFYLSLLLADRMQQRSAAEKNRMAELLSKAPEIQPAFFHTNSINTRYTGRAPGMRPGEIFRQRAGMTNAQADHQQVLRPASFNQREAIGVAASKEKA